MHVSKLVPNKIQLTEFILGFNEFKPNEKITLFLIEHRNSTRKQQSLTVRNALERITNCPTGDQLRFTKAGKPLWNGNLELSISHSGKLSVLLLAEKDQECSGVDVEFISPLDVKPFLKYLHDEELKLILTNDEPGTALILIWTRKEALLKAIGSGLTDTMNQINTCESSVEVGDKKLYLASYIYSESSYISIATTSRKSITFPLLLAKNNPIDS